MRNVKLLTGLLTKRLSRTSNARVKVCRSKSTLGFHEERLLPRQKSSVCRARKKLMREPRFSWAVCLLKVQSLRNTGITLPRSCIKSLNCWDIAK